MAGAGFGIPGLSLAMADAQKVRGDGAEAISVMGCPGHLWGGRALTFRIFLFWVGRAGEGGKESELNSSFSLSFLSLCL